MVSAEDILSSVPNDLVNNVSFLVNILQALGVAILVYIIFNVISLFFARKKQREIQKINENLEAIKKLLAKNHKRR